MGPVARSWLACLAVVFSACSLVVDFPDKAPSSDDDKDSGLDSGEREPDASRDARADTGRDTAVDATFATCAKHTDCDKSELCCPVESFDTCVATNVQRCGDCNQGCSDPRAPNCGARVCECVAGTGKACEPGQVCGGQGADAKCVECATNNDCVMNAGHPFCVANKCVQCDRGAMLDSSADDVGCSGAASITTPICGADSTCVGCDDSKPETKCSGNLRCSPGLGCGGCRVGDGTIGENINGCPDASPVCKLISQLTQCVGCTANLDCKFSGGQGYCTETTKLCSNKCDGDAPVGANGCTNPAAGFCKPAAGVPGGVDCAACVQADCNNGTFCATTGAKAGSCVQCRTNTDCPGNGLVPVCDQTSFTCRARTMADCAATPATPVLDPNTGSCVQCTTNANCTTGKVCSPTLKTCVECANHADCGLDKPSCNAATNLCEAKCTPSLCNASHAMTKCNDTATACVECLASSDCTKAPSMPVCSAQKCVACSDLPMLASDIACSALQAGTRCVTGPDDLKGRCAACDPARPMSTCNGIQTCSINASTRVPACGP